MIFKVPGVPKFEKSQQKVTFKRKLAARASWEAPGIDVGVIWGSFWVPKSLRKGVRKRAEICNEFETL